MSETQLWIVGQWSEAEPWQFAGVFASEAAARDACRDGTYFIGPAILGESVPHERADWPGCYYPKLIAA